MDYVYVVTVSRHGAEQGEFSGTPTAYESEFIAQLAARECRQAIGGRFTEIDKAGAGDHIVTRWDSDQFSVWVERLVFEAAQ